MHHHLHLLTLLVATAVGCQWLASLLRVPAILLLLAAGIALGPGFGMLEPRELFGDLLDPFVGLAVAVILFDGGLSLNLHEARAAGGALWRLLLSGLVVGFALVLLAAIWLGGLSIGTAAVLAGILVVTGPTVVLPMLRTARIARRPATLLKWEGIVNDPFGALLAIFMFRLAADFAHPGAGAWSIAGHFALGMLGSAAIGLCVGFALDKALDRGLLAEHLKSPVMLGVVLLVYTLAEMVGEESGLLAVTVMGLLLANVENPHVEDIRRFKEQVSTLLIGMLFVTLSSGLHVHDLRRLVGAPLLLLGVIVFLVRPVVVACASLRTDTPWRERALLAWIAPRGVVAAAVAGAFEPRLLAAGYADAELLVPLVFGVIVVTVTLQSLTLRPLARRLGLSAADGSGILIVGGAIWVLELARALRRAGAEVTMAETTYRRVSRARREGLDVHFGDVLAEDIQYELPMERLSWAFAASDDDAYNSLVCTRLQSQLGRGHVLQLAPQGDGRKDAEHQLMGRVAWADASYQEMTRRFWNNGVFKVTNLTAEYPFAKLQAQNPGALFLFCMRGGRLSVVEVDKPPAEDAKVVFLTDPNAAAPG